MTDHEYDELFRAAYPRLVATGLAMSTSRHVSQELAQETLLRAHHHRDELGGGDSSISWCRRVMGELLVEHHRSSAQDATEAERLERRVQGIAMAATLEHEQTVSSQETEAALNAVRSRIAAGDLGGAPPSIPIDSPTNHRRSPWVRFGAIAAVVAMVALGLVAVAGGDGSNDVVTPATVPSVDSGPTIESTVASTTTTPATEADA